MLHTTASVIENDYTQHDVYALLIHLNINYKSTCEDIHFNKFCSINTLENSSITWIKKINKEHISLLKQHSNVLVFSDINYFDDDIKNIIYVPNLKRSFFRIIGSLFKKNTIASKVPLIEKTATMLSKHIGKNLYLGHNSFIDKDVVLGDNVMIMNNVVIQGKVSIGNDTFIESGAAIGVEGFGFFRNEDGNHEKVPHLGGVMIGNHVFIGANTCICKGSIDNTIIEDYAKIDNLCHIAHSTKIQENAVIIACSEISGSVHIGKNTWIAPGVTILNGLTIGNNVCIGIGSNIVKDVPDNVLIYGNPGKIKEVK